jgi:hypothetical protein
MNPRHLPAYGYTGLLLSHSPLWSLLYGGIHWSGSLAVDVDWYFVKFSIMILRVSSFLTLDLGPVPALILSSIDCFYIEQLGPYI